MPLHLVIELRMIFKLYFLPTRALSFNINHNLLWVAYSTRRKPCCPPMVRGALLSAYCVFCLGTLHQVWRCARRRGVASASRVPFIPLISVPVLCNLNHCICDLAGHGLYCIPGRGE